MLSVFIIMNYDVEVGDAWGVAFQWVSLTDVASIRCRCSWLAVGGQVAL